MCETKEINIIDATHSILSEEVIDLQVMHDGMKYRGILYKVD